MEESGEKKIKKALKSSKIYLLITIISIIAIIVGIVLIVKADEIADEEPIDMVQMRKDEIYDEENTSGKYVYLDIDEISKPIVIETSDDDALGKKYYFTVSYFNGNNGELYYMVNVAKVSEAEYLGLNNFVNQFYEYDETMKDTYRFEGTTRKMPDDLKKLVIDSYEKVFEQEGITEDDLIEMTGTVYLQVGSKPEDEVVAIGVMIIIFGSLGFLICGITYLIINGRTRNTLKRLKKAEELDDVYSELELSEQEFMGTKTFFTKNYVIDASEGLQIFKYSEIKWIYPHSQQLNWAEVEKSIVIRLKDKKIYKIARIKSQSKNLYEYKKVLDLLLEKVPEETIKGYSKENEKRFKELIKN